MSIFKVGMVKAFATPAGGKGGNSGKTATANARTPATGRTSAATARRIRNRNLNATGTPTRG